MQGFACCKARVLESGVASKHGPFHYSSLSELKLPAFVNMMTSLQDRAGGAAAHIQQVDAPGSIGSCRVADGMPSAGAFSGGQPPAVGGPGGSSGGVCAAPDPQEAGVGCIAVLIAIPGSEAKIAIRCVDDAHVQVLHACITHVAQMKHSRGGLLYC